MLFTSDKLGFIQDEMASYMWKKDPHDKPKDEPEDRNDHACDTIKYMLSDSPEIGEIHEKLESVPAWMQWHESERNNDRRKPRYG
jgi:hypothetical protein